MRSALAGLALAFLSGCVSSEVADASRALHREARVFVRASQPREGVESADWTAARDSYLRATDSLLRLVETAE